MEVLATSLRASLLYETRVFNNTLDWANSTYVDCDGFVIVDTPANQSDACVAEIISLLVTSGNGAPIIVVSDDDRANNIARNLALGPRGFISTNSTFETALAAIQLVLAGSIYVPGNSALS